jgi:hypothetical protein
MGEMDTLVKMGQFVPAATSRHSEVNE